MNETIRLLKSHRSIRKFQDRPVSEEELWEIVSAAQHASTSSNIQAYSIIRVRDAELRARLAACAGGQAYVQEAPEFLVWCADLLRLTLAAGLPAQQGGGGPDEGEDRAGSAPHPAETTELLLAAVADAALASQNAAIAAESLGLGIVYIGGIRNRLEEVCALLRTPPGVLPLFGMCIGWPDQEPMLRPRLPMEAVLHENAYGGSDSYAEAVREYDATTADYYRARTQGKRIATWSEEMKAKLSGRERDYLAAFVRRHGFDRQASASPPSTST